MGLEMNFLCLVIIFMSCKFFGDSFFGGRFVIDGSKSSVSYRAIKLLNLDWSLGNLLRMLYVSVDIFILVMIFMLKMFRILMNLLYVLRLWSFVFIFLKNVSFFVSVVVARFVLVFFGVFGGNFFLLCMLCILCFFLLVVGCVELGKKYVNLFKRLWWCLNNCVIFS